MLLERLLLGQWGTGSGACIITEADITRNVFKYALSTVQNGTVVAWAEKPDGSWARTLVHDFGAPVWRVSWSITGQGSQGFLKAPGSNSKRAFVCIAHHKIE